MRDDAEFCTGLRRACVASALLMPLSGTAALAQKINSFDSICGSLEAAALRSGIPAGFFSRLIWQESRFDASARSPAGAEGIAQFMPRTASSRGLIDPFQASDSLFQSAGYLKELRQTFGNFGLAAAAYNAGPGKLGRWLSGEAVLPQETVNYVQLVTGHSVEEWRSVQPPTLATQGPFSCPRFATSMAASPKLARPTSSWPTLSPHGGDFAKTKPWAVVLVASLKNETALAEYQIVRSTFSKILQNRRPSVVKRHIGVETPMRYVVQIDENDRASGSRLCMQLRSSGGSCAVMQNVAQSP